MSTELKTLNGYGFDATKLGGLDAQYYAQGRAAYNLLDNSWFVNPVNQRGQTSYTGAGYTIDRWKAGVSDCSMYVKAGESVAFNTKTEGVNAYWRQYLPHSLSQLEGKTFTLAIKDTWGNTHCASGVYPTSAPSATKSVIWINMYENVSIVLYCATDGTAFVQLSTKKSVPIVWVALYEGSYTADTLPAYQPKGYAAELAECRRYYKVIDVYVAPWLQEGTNIRRYYVGYEPMRTAPTVDVSGLKEYSIWTDMKSTINPYNIKNNRVLLNATAETTSTSFYIGGSIALSSDL